MLRRKYIKMANPKISHKGFSLAEIVVAITLLGVVSVFAIPKILSIYEDNSRKTVFLETINVLENILTVGMATGDLKTGTTMNGGNYIAYFMSRINAARSCPTASKDEGCWDESIQGSNTEAGEPGVVLASGAVITGFDNDNGSNGILIDWNGSRGPNELGSDQLWINTCIGTINCNNNTDDQVPGTIEPMTKPLTAEKEAANVQLYEWILDE